MFSIVGDIMINVGRYLECRRGVQYRGGYHEYHGGLSLVPWGTLSTMEGYHEYHGGVQYHGDTIPCNLSTMGGYHDTCGDIMSTVEGV